MTPVLKIAIGSILVIVVCAAVIIPTVIVLKNKNDQGNTTATTRLTTRTSTNSVVSSRTTSRQAANSSSAGGSTTVVANTTRVSTTTLPVTTTLNTSLFSSSYSSNLTNQNQGACPTAVCWDSVKFYQAFLLNVTVSGSYRILSASTLDTMGYLYNQSFNPRNFDENLITSDDESNGNNQFLLVVQLTTNRVYILVFTTYFQNRTGPYTVSGTGPGLLGFIPINISVANETVLRTNIPVSFSNNGTKFCRPISCASSNYFYQAFPFNVSATGVYSISSSSDIDTYGILYINTFIPSNASSNILATDDDSAGSSQFLLRMTLSIAVRYILVVTTYYENTFGSVAVSIVGPGSTNMIS